MNVLESYPQRQCSMAYTVKITEIEELILHSFAAYYVSFESLI